MAGHHSFNILALGRIFVPFLLSSAVHAASCTYIPSDAEWPSPADWAALNSTIGGRLIATVPIGSVCHTTPYQRYDEAACAALAAGWNSAETLYVFPINFAATGAGKFVPYHGWTDQLLTRVLRCSEPHPAEMMNAYYQNQSCDPFTDVSRPCELGNYAVYSINVSSADDVLAGISFAKEKNVRLVVKTTGHDYNGRSSGQGVLSLWTWNLKASEIIPEYTSNWYSGPAMKIGAGVIVGEANTIAHASGYHVVGGECGSVGLAAGYTQGGGHSMLNTAYGMAADQVLEWEVVTPQGELLIATPEKNSDLYWALSGGGGGTFGVVLSMTARIYPEVAVAGGQLSFQNTNETSFWKGVSLWFGHSRALANDNNTIIFLVHHDHFQVVAMTLPGQPETAVSDLLSPVLSELESLGIEYRFNTLSSSSYFEHFKTHFGPLPYGPNPPSTILINRIIPEAVVQSETSNAEWMSAVRSTVAGGDFLVGCAIMLVGNATHPPNAVLPAWRKTSVSCNVNAYWNYRAPLSTNLELKRRLVEEHMPALEAATPGGGVYLNEMDPWYKGDWKANLYGDNYDRLLDIKHRVDPDFLFWGNFSVASDERVLHGNGRLCKV